MRPGPAAFRHSEKHLNLEYAGVHMGGMWTKEHRARQAAFEQQRYPTDLTNEE